MGEAKRAKPAYRLTSFDQLATLTPANRSTATAIRGTHDDPKLTRGQLRENLLPTLRRLEWALQNASDKQDRKRIVQQMEKVREALRVLKPTQYPRDFANFFMDSAREMLPPATFRLIKEDAKRKALERQREAAEAEQKAGQIVGAAGKTWD